ncbi:putative SWR1-complex protein 5 [Amylocarpus encephaloides]|uniref:SWR1-complex protein 5 n=1 Tax=Amylocarpus encephaloides TaxID=45428 RepID=A0A9P7YN06_9HELO|nr:putative SWR1-complex protein 5 [Amylocarpus encephaloides]
MPPALILDDEEYASEEDSDFVEDAGPAKGDDDSSDDEAEPNEVEVTANPPRKRKRGPDEEAEDLGIENSGDEAIITRGLKRRKNKKGKAGDVENDEGGEGGLVKTRSMRAAEKVERKVTLQDTSKSTIDVDSMWANMITGKPLRPASKTQPPPSPQTSRVKDIQSPTITLFLASQPPPSPSVSEPPSDTPFKPKRPPKKARRSIFEPIVDLPPRTDLHFGIRKLVEGIEVLGMKDGGKKLNTVEKSAMDWAGFVDQEGIADELDAAGKSKGAYKSRQEFLARVERKKEEEARRARGVVS